MIRIILSVIVMSALLPGMAQGQSDRSDLPLYYAVERDAMVYSAPDSSKPSFVIKMREPLFMLRDLGGWMQIRTQHGSVGYVSSHAVSNVWMRVSKKSRTLFVYRGTELVREIAADFGYNAFADKVKRGSVQEPDHWRTPDGVFYVIRKNPHSQFYKAFVLNYPTAEDAERGRAQNLISEAQYDAIMQAEEEMRMPPMNTALGGYIEIHGHGTGAGVNWTQGCVAVHDHEIDQIWQLAQVGTPVLIE